MHTNNIDVLSRRAEQHMEVNETSIRSISGIAESVTNKLIMINKYLIIFSSLIILFSTSTCSGQAYTPTHGDQIVGSAEFLEGEVKKVTIIRKSGGRVSWSPKGDYILIDQKGEDEYYDLYLIRPDGSEEQCLTCETGGALSKGHKGTAEWHPSGKYIVFQSQKKKDTGNFGRDIAAKPGFGRHMDLWLMEVKTKRVFQLTHTKDSDDTGVLHPHFSHDGQKLTWSEMYKAPGMFGKAKDAGYWKIKIASFSFNANKPLLSNIKAYEPGGPGLYENHGLSPDGDNLLFTATFEGGNFFKAANIYQYNIKLNKLDKLAYEKYNEHAHYSHNGRKIIWMTSAQNKNNGTDYWAMDTDGSNKRRLTSFNNPKNKNYKGKMVISADASFNPTGTKLVAYLQLNLLTQDGPIVVIDLKEGWDR